MADLRQASATAEFPPVLLFAMATPDQATAFFADRWGDARVVCDPELRFYRGFGRGRGTLRQVMGFKAVAAGLRALRKGHSVGRPIGDPLVMPGMFLVRDDSIVWEHPFEHSADHPDLAEVARIARD